MKLLSLNLENFQGIKSASFSFGGENVNIYGDNATGKSTIFNAITWLLFDKPSTGAKNFSPKTKGPEGDLHYLDHAAEAQFQLDGGRVTTIRKVYHETYTKKRGSNTEEFTGHTVDYYLDGVPVKEKDYCAAIQDLCGEQDQAKLLTMVNYFPEELPWESRRKILLDLCGEITDADVIAGTPTLKELPTYLLKPGTTDQHYTVDEYKKIASAKKSDINKKLQDVPGRIDEAQRAMPDTTNLDPEAIAATIAKLDAERQTLETEKAQVKAGNSAAANVRTQIAEQNAQLSEARSKHLAANYLANKTTQAEITQVQDVVFKLNSDIRKNGEKLTASTTNYEQLQNLRKSLLDEYTRVQAETWDESKETCVLCNQTLPPEQIEAVRGEFNLLKSQRLEAINTRGKTEASKEMLAAEQIQAEELAKKIAADRNKLKELNQRLGELEKQLEKADPFEQTEEYTLINKKITDLQAEEQDADKLIEKALAEFDQKIQIIQVQIKAQQDLKAQLDLAQIQQKRIEELKANEKQLSSEYETLEQGIFLCEQFIRAKVNLLTNKINGKFNRVRFRLFQEQINGGLKEDCEVMIPAEGGRLVPFAFANNAARINAGLEIIGTLSKHWGLEMPVFIDNAESITKLEDINNQVIRLVVSESDQKLRLEADTTNTTTKKAS